jgi:hypothetical protein
LFHVLVNSLEKYSTSIFQHINKTTSTLIG